MERRSIKIDGYSHQNPIPLASRVGDLLVSSVISAVDPATGETPGSFEDQCAQVFSNMRAILAAAGASPDCVAKVSFYIEDLAQRTVINRFWVEMFPDEDARPARHTQQGDLAAGRLISADFIAFVGD